MLKSIGKNEVVRRQTWIKVKYKCIARLYVRFAWTLR